MANSPEDDDAPAGDDQPLVVPAGALPLDAMLLVAARAVRRAAVGARLRQGASLTAGRSLRELSQRAGDLCNEGAMIADRIDADAKAAQKAQAQLLAELRERLIFMGTDRVPDAYSILGWDEHGRPIALSHDGGQIIMAMGQLGSGKSHMSVALAEACLRPIIGLTSPWVRPTAVVAFHTNLVNATLPQILAGLRKNRDPKDLRDLAERLGVTVTGPIERMNLVLPEWLIKEYHEALAPYVALGLRVLPLKLHIGQLSLTALEALLGGGEAQYLQHILEMVIEQGDQVDPAAVHQAIDECAELNRVTRAAAHRRMRLLTQISSRPDQPGLWDLVGPNELTVFHLSGRRIGRNDVLPLCVTLLCALSEPSAKHGPIQRVFLLDEINRFDKDSPLWRVLMQVGRQIRHQGSMLVMMGQDFMGVPDEMLGLATVFAMFRVRSQKIFDHARERVEGYRGRDLKEVSLLKNGDALVSVSQSTDESWPEAARWMHIRPLCCEHGGHTRAEL